MKTDEEKKEIAYFDELENFKADRATSENLAEEKGLLHSIAALDNIMTQNPLENAGPTFVDSLVLSLSKAKRRKSIYRMFAFVFGIFAIMIGISWFWAMGEQDITTPLYLNNVVEKFNTTLSFISDPRFKQMFLISEAIVCLVIVEKIVSGYRMFKFS